MKPYQKIISIICAVVVWAGCTRATHLPEATVIFLDSSTQPISIYIADTPEEREAGLAAVPDLLSNQGMLFLFDEPQQPVFWMKDVDYPIDILWLYDTTIIDSTTNLEPESPSTALENYQRYAPNVPVTAVLEVPAGFVQDQNITIGQVIEIQSLK